MKSRDARKQLEGAGFKFLRMGRGSHMIFQKGARRIVISEGEELSSGMTKKVRSFVCKEGNKK